MSQALRKCYGTLFLPPIIATEIMAHTTAQMMFAMSDFWRNEPKDEEDVLPPASSDMTFVGSLAVPPAGALPG